MGEKNRLRLRGYVSMKTNSKYENHVIVFKKYQKYGVTLRSAILTWNLFNNIENFRFSVIYDDWLLLAGKIDADVYVNKGKNHLCFAYISPSY